MADIINLHPVVTTTTPQDSSEESRVVRIAKLGLILADKDTDPMDKVMCVKLSVRQGIITSEEATQLLASRSELEEFMTDSTEDK